MGHVHEAYVVGSAHMECVRNGDTHGVCMCDGGVMSSHLPPHTHSDKTVGVVVGDMVSACWSGALTLNPLLLLQQPMTPPQGTDFMQLGFPL